MVILSKYNEPVYSILSSNLKNTKKENNKNAKTPKKKLNANTKGLKHRKIALMKKRGKNQSRI